MLQQGQTLAGYRIDSVAGIGGMGVVYRATQLSLDRPVALKVLSSTLVGNRSFRERFRREGRHAAALEHPNIIPVYEAGESNGLMFIAMRLVDGPTLADLMHDQAVSGRETLRIMAAIASALDAAHEAGLVHRDVKPQNILLTGGGHPYLADFGITKGSAAGGLTRTGDFVGSLSYVAPEQMDGADVGPESDIYSLAAVLFQCLTGALPYERETDAALMHAHLFAPPPTVSDLGPGIPRELDDVFARGLAKAPAERYPSGGELVQACADVLGAMPDPVLDRAPALLSAAARRERDEVPAAPRVAPPVSPSTPAVSAAPIAAAQLTEADRKRPAAEPPTESPAKTKPRPSVPRPAPAGKWALVAAGAALLLAPLAGYALGGGGGSDEPAPTRYGTAVSLEAGDGWRRGEGGVPGLRLDDAVSLQHESGVVLASGRVADPAAGLDPTGERFRATLPGAKPQTVKIGERSAVRYAGEQAGGGSAWVALLPDDKGWTAVACRSAASDAALEQLCAPIAEGIQAKGANPADVAPDRKLASTVEKSLEELNGVRGEAKEDLAAKGPKTRADAASDVAAAHARAAAAIAGYDARPQDAALTAELAKQLRRGETAFQRLASAAKSKNRSAYNQARERVREADEGIARAVERLARGGYETS